jgi:hypothetical protein
VDRERGQDQGAHYRVVRYYGDQGHGVFKEVLEENLSFEEAERLAGSVYGRPGEDIVVQDQDLVGIESEVQFDPYRSS